MCPGLQPTPPPCTNLNEACAFNTMMKDHFPADLVSPAAAYLAHEEREVSGAYLEDGAGNVALPTEPVRDNLATIADKSTAAIIPDFWEAAPAQVRLRKWASFRSPTRPCEPRSTRLDLDDFNQRKSGGHGPVRLCAVRGGGRGMASEHETALPIFGWAVTASVASIYTDGFASLTALTD